MRRLGLSAAVLSLGLLSLAAPASAQRSFVSAVTGSDSNPCSRSSPCRSFGTAIAAVGGGGEVVVLDSGGYGPVTITKAITIESPAGIYAGINVSPGNGISVNAGPFDTVTLRGLTLTQTPASGTAITFTAGGTLTIENCVVDGWYNGVIINAGSPVIVRDSVFKNLAGEGIRVSPASGIAVATVVRCQFETNANVSLSAHENAKVWARDCVFTGGHIGAQSLSAGATSELDLRNCLFTNNNLFALLAETFGGGVAIARVSGSMIMGNTTGLSQITNATLESYGDNDVRGNTSDTIGTITQIGSTRK
jgi:hypothetical protein